MPRLTSPTDWSYLAIHRLRDHFFNHLRLVCQYLVLRDTDKVVVVVAGEMGRLFRTAILIG